MKISFVGLGKMGSGMAEQLLEKGHEVSAFDSDETARERAKFVGAVVFGSVSELVQSLEPPRLLWVMVPHQSVDSVLEEITPLLEKGDTVIDGGNSPYKESIRRSLELVKKGIDFLDVGVSGGPSGARHGACVMVGGREEVFKKYENLFKDISAPDAYGYMGNAGAGHFVKMVHNGIEYGMMQALAEGFAIMKKSDFDLDFKKIADVYNHQSVIESRLVGWLKQAYEKHGENLEKISGQISHTGEGLWTVETARELGVPIPIIEGALKFRTDSETNPSYTGQIVSVLRGEFGGHDVKKE